MTAVKDFMDNPVEFMRNNIVMQGVSGMSVKSNTDLFTFYPAGNEGQIVKDGKTIKVPVYNMMKAADVNADEGNRFRAYWCKYKDDSVQAITLADEAEYMFTAKMDGCSFGVGMPGLDGSVRVAHANVQADQALLDLDQAISTESGKKKPDKELIARLNVEKLGKKKGLQTTQLTGSSGVDNSLSTVIGPLDYKVFGLCSTTFGVRESGTWNFYFHTYKSVGITVELIGCFPFPKNPPKTG